MRENTINQQLNTMSEKKLTRIVVMGDAGVGKSALITRCLKNVYHPPTPPGKATSYRYNDYFGKKNVTLDIVDYNGKNDALISCADGFIICYSITDRKSFEAIDDYLDKIVDASIKHPKISIVGNKSDLYNEREISSNEGYQLAKEINALFYETSAKIPVIDIRQVFYDLYRAIKNAKKSKKGRKYSDDMDSDVGLSLMTQSVINTTGLLGFSRCCSHKGYLSGLKNFSRKAITNRSRRISRDASI